ncbi:lipid A biosynthesis acyltransferase [Variovorax sp. VNK109]|uniref:LpxL/LpxP family acyltransferase n=1 Tax=Variovorax sp. VNK109 TaxID=3400919 RepID=UPI003C032D65
MITSLGIWFMKVLAHLPLRPVRALGWLLGWGLYIVAVSRRRVVHANLALCFPDKPGAWRTKVARASFVCFAQAWLDRSWLWHGNTEVTKSRLNLIGAVDELQGHTPTVIFLPHFYGMDAAWSAVSAAVPRRFTTIFTPQRNKRVDDWIYEGRRRLGEIRLFDRFDGVKTIVSALRAGEPLFLLPDMNFGAEESIFVPFYGVPAATVPSLSRFAKLGRAKVVPVTVRMTAQGYDVEVHAAWPDFPSDDVVADTARMNLNLQGYIDTMPEQYYWVHKRFKTRPAGEPPVY